MVIHKVKAAELKGKQQEEMVWNCINHWTNINNIKYPYYHDVMNIKPYRINDEHDCYVSTSYHIKLKKW